VEVDQMADALKRPVFSANLPKMGGKIKDYYLSKVLGVG
jgi:hypothetical protein